MRNSKLDAILIVVLGVALVMGALAFIRARGVSSRSEMVQTIDADAAGEVYEHRIQQTYELLRADNIEMGSR